MVYDFVLEKLTAEHAGGDDAVLAYAAMRLVHLAIGWHALPVPQVGTDSQGRLRVYAFSMHSLAMTTAPTHCTIATATAIAAERGIDPLPPGGG